MPRACVACTCRRRLVDAGSRPGVTGGDRARHDARPRGRAPACSASCRSMRRAIDPATSAGGMHDRSLRADEGRAVIRLALIVACVLATAPGSAGAVTRYALVIGNDTGDRDEMALRYAENDAEHFAATLVDLGGFQPGDVIVLRGGDADAARAALIALNDRIRHRRPRRHDARRLLLRPRRRRSAAPRRDQLRARPSSSSSSAARRPRFACSSSTRAVPGR